MKFHVSVISEFRMSIGSALCTSTLTTSGPTIIIKPRVGLWTTATCNSLDWHKTIGDVIDHAIIARSKFFHITNIVIVNFIGQAESR